MEKLTFYRLLTDHRDQLPNPWKLLLVGEGPDRHIGIISLRGVAMERDVPYPAPMFQAAYGLKNDAGEHLTTLNFNANDSNQVTWHEKGVTLTSQTGITLVLPTTAAPRTRPTIRGRRITLPTERTPFRALPQVLPSSLEALRAELGFPRNP